MEKTKIKKKKPGMAQLYYELYVVRLDGERKPLFDVQTSDLLCLPTCKKLEQCSIKYLLIVVYFSTKGPNEGP